VSDYNLWTFKELGGTFDYKQDEYEPHSEFMGYEMGGCDKRFLGTFGILLTMDKK
jgi:hypothetical protein